MARCEGGGEDHGQGQGLGAGTIAAICLAVGMGSITTDMYFPAMPAIQREFGGTATAIQATLSVYLLGLALGQLVFGPVSDRLGRRPVLLGGLAMFVAGCLLAAVSSSLVPLLGARFLQAVGAAAALVVARATVADGYSGTLAARLQNLLTQVLAAAAIGAPLAGATLLVWAGWRSIFEVLAGLGVVALTLAVLLLRETLPRERRTGGSLARQVAAWRMLLADRVYVLLVLAGACGLAGIYEVILGSSFVLIGEFGWSPTRYGVAYGGATVAFVAMGWCNDRLLERWRIGAILVAALSLQVLVAAAVYLAGLAGLLGADAVAVNLIAANAVYAFVYGNVIALAMERVRSNAGLGAGLMGAAQYAVSALVPGVAGLIGGSVLHAMATTNLAFMVLALAFLTAALRHGEVKGVA